MPEFSNRAKFARNGPPHRASFRVPRAAIMSIAGSVLWATTVIQHARAAEGRRLGWTQLKRTLQVGRRVRATSAIAWKMLTGETLANRGTTAVAAT